MIKRIKMSPYIKLAAMLGIEGALFQYVISSNTFGNFIYATNLGATDTMIGLTQSVPQIVALLLLLPIGIIGNKFKSSKTMPVIILCFMSIMYACYGSVPFMGDLKMFLFFVFLGGTSGMIALYNTAWQIFFAETVNPDDRNSVFIFRNGAMFAVGTIIPLFIGSLVNGAGASSSKLGILQIFYYACGVVSLITALIISRTPSPDRSNGENLEIAVKLKDIPAVLAELFKNKAFITVIGSIMFLYLSWQIDWSMWYIGQVRYVGYNEAHLSYQSAVQSFVQLAVTGFLGRLNQKKGIYFTMIIGCVGLAFYPLAMITAVFLPKAIAPWALIIMYNMCSTPATALLLCIMQIVLDVAPKKNRGITLSLYAMAITLSNAIMPLFGVFMYTLLGANLKALIIFFIFAFLMRVISVILFVQRYKDYKLKRKNIL